MAEVAMPHNEIRALYTDTTITVYQAYTPQIGVAAAHDGRSRRRGSATG